MPQVQATPGAERRGVLRLQIHVPYLLHCTHLPDRRSALVTHMTDRTQACRLNAGSFEPRSFADMDKATWIDAFVLHMIELGNRSPRLGQLAERLWPHLCDIDPEAAARGQHVIGDTRPGAFPDTRPDEY